MTGSSHAGWPSFSKWRISIFFSLPLLLSSWAKSTKSSSQLPVCVISTIIFENARIRACRAPCNPRASLVSSVFAALNLFPLITIDLQGDKVFWSWQPGLSDLGADQQPVWAQGPGWIYMRAAAAADPPSSCLTLGFLIKSLILEAVREWDTVFCNHRGNKIRGYFNKCLIFFCVVILMCSVGRV